MAYTPYYAAWHDFPNVTTPITAAALQNIDDELVRQTAGDFSVLGYGAVGDGVSDDTAAFQAAIDAASAAATAAGGNARARVVVPGPNTYLLSYGSQRTGFNYWNALNIKSNVELVGIGRPRLFANQVGVHTVGQVSRNIIGRDANPGNNSTPVNNWAIRDLILDGGFVSDQRTTGQAFPDATEDFFGINVDAANVFEITGNYVIGIYGDSIRFGDVSFTDAVVRDNYITLFNGQAIVIVTGRRAIIANNILYDNQATAGGSAEALECEAGTHDATITGNIVVNAGTLGALGHNITVTGNYVAPWGGVFGAIETGVGSNVTVTGNVVDLSIYGPDLTAASKGIIAVSTPGLTVSGNVVRMSNGALFNAAGAIDVSLCTNPTVFGNTVCSAGTSAGTGVDINVATSPGAVIASNRCAALPRSIVASSANNLVNGNMCSGSIEIGTQSNTATRILVKNNKMVAATGTLTQALTLNNQGNIIEGNQIDVSGSTGRGIYQYGYNTGEGNIFRNNVIVGASGVIVWDENFHGVGDTWDNNTILGGGEPWGGAGSTFLRPTGGYTTLTFPGSGGAVATVAPLGDLCRLTVTDATAFTISNPKRGTNTALPPGYEGTRLTYDVKNSSGGAMGTITWGNAFLLAGSFTNPANGKRRTISFYWDGTNWVETNRVAADI